MTTRARWALTGVLALLPLLGWWATGLFDLDEGFYAAVVAEMNRRGEWVTPYFNGKPWFEKPILLYWLAKPSVALFGESIGPRLPSVLATLATYTLVALFARRHSGAPSSFRATPYAGESVDSQRNEEGVGGGENSGAPSSFRVTPYAGEPERSQRNEEGVGGGENSGAPSSFRQTPNAEEPNRSQRNEEGVGGGEKTAQLATLILASSLLVVALGRMMMTDAPLLFALTGAFLSFWESLVGDRRWRIVTAALLGVGVLAKGPVAGLLFIPVIGWTYYREPELRATFRGYWLPGIAALLAIVATWYVPAYQANGQTFVQKFLIEQNIGRFTGGDAAHTLGWQSLPAYIPIVLLGMLPWSLWIFAAWPRKTTSDPLTRYLATWAAVVFLFFSISGAKLPHYILPVFPPLALLVARHLSGRKWSWPTAAALCLAMAVIANVGFGIWYEKSGQQAAHSLARYIRAQGGKVAVYQLPRRQRDRGTGKAKLQETSLPSLLLYLNTTAMEANGMGELLTEPASQWIFTRPGRLGTTEMVAAAHDHRRLERIPGAPGAPNYELWRLTAR